MSEKDESDDPQVINDALQAVPCRRTANEPSVCRVHSSPMNTCGGGIAVAAEVAYARGRADAQAEGARKAYEDAARIARANAKDWKHSDAPRNSDHMGAIALAFVYEKLAQEQPASTDAQAEHEQHEFVACGRCSCTTVPTTRYFMCEECARAGWPTRAEHEQQVREAVLREREEIEARLREVAGHYDVGSDGRNTFVMMADWVSARSTAQQPAATEGVGNGPGR